jgi:hypothetical protein
MKSGGPRQRLLSGRELEHKPQAHGPLSGTVARGAKCDMLEPQ